MACEDLKIDLQLLLAGETKHIVEQRIQSFEQVEDQFSELCYCIMTANTTAEKSIEIQKALRHEFHHADQKTLHKALKERGYRLTNRAAFICHNRQFFDLRTILKQFKDERTAREWLVTNIKGFGYKEASHFLRNTGSKNVAIIDRHVLRLLCRYGIISEIPVSLSRHQYLDLEERLSNIANHLGITLAELDLYLWYLETGKILK